MNNTETLDISQETNKEKLESLAYREIKVIDRSRANLDALNMRIAQLEKEEAGKSAEDTESQQ